MYVTFDHSENLTNGIATFWFKSDTVVDYQAGQFIELSLPHNKPDSRGLKRWFTLSSSPTEDLLGITTRYTKMRPSSFKKTLLELEPGTKVSFSDPMGDFVLPIDENIPLLFVAAGIGITPVRSIVKSLIDSGQKRSINIIYGAKDTNDLVFLPTFTRYGLKPIVILTNDNYAQSSRIGRIEAQDILDVYDRQTNGLIFISGPGQMVESLESGLIAASISPEQLVLDYFPGYPAT
ncbi:MAG: FAD-dependent oxidoreductase [Candidatus Saccharimonadales bacterium]